MSPKGGCSLELGMGSLYARAGRREQAEVSIPNELEHGLPAYVTGHFFPSPTELLRIGVCHERNSYVWGILRALLIDDAPAVRSIAAHAMHFVSRWRITAMPELGQEKDAVEDGHEPLYLSLRPTTSEDLSGEYRFGLCGGILHGAVREFGGERIFIQERVICTLGDCDRLIEVRVWFAYPYRHAVRAWRELDFLGGVALRCTRNVDRGTGGSAASSRERASRASGFTTSATPSPAIWPCGASPSRRSARSSAIKTPR